MITEFRGEYSFLSNFTYFDKPLNFQGINYKTNEHFYIAMKTKDVDKRFEVSMHPSKGLKKFGRTLKLRADWEDIKLKVMNYGLEYKFSILNPKLRSKLLATKDLHIQEGNYWNDKYWGVCLKTGEGENHLGRLLMKVRADEAIAETLQQTLDEELKDEPNVVGGVLSLETRSDYL
jgi:ribA/ribD-fused uncharacterized protein